jgi:acetyl-CoA C-acetyltransferase
MGRFGGSFREMPVYDLASQVIGKLLLSLKLPPDELDEVIIGHCRQAGNGPNPARTAAVKGGVPLRVPVSTINMACPSGMKALEMASFRLMLGGARFILVGGMESMSTMPYLLKDCRWNGFKMGNRTLYDGWADSTDPLINQGMGETAESLARKYGISRAAQDEYAAASHEKAHKAWEAGYFNGEVIPVEGMEGLVEKDETIRYPADIEKLAKLKPVFDKAGTVTAANACAMGDGAAFMVLSRKDVVASAGLPVLGELVGISQCAVDPAFMGEGPSAAIPLCLEETGMTRRCRSP